MITFKFIRFYSKTSHFNLEIPARNIPNNMNAFKYKTHLQKIFLDSVAAVNPVHLIRETLKIRSGKLYVLEKSYEIKKDIYLVGFGKAVLGMASESERILSSHLKQGLICVPENIQETFQSKPEFQLRKNTVIKVIEGANNNLPDRNAELGADEIIRLIQDIDVNDILIVLISGGGSALLPKPNRNITLNEKTTTIKLLASAGADINELNTVRKKLSVLKGGGLAELSYPKQTISLILSDVINNPLDIIASGPTVPNQDTDLAAVEILKKYQLESKVSKAVLETLNEKSGNQNVPVTGNKYPHVDNYLIGYNLKAIVNGQKYAESLGYKSVILSSKMEGLVGHIADFYSVLSFEICATFLHGNMSQFHTRLDAILRMYNIKVENSFRSEIFNKIEESKTMKGLCIISGGETTVQVKGDGKGGRNQELALAFSQRLHELKTRNPQVFIELNPILLSAGTDGIDGPTDVAGAIGSADVIDIASQNNLNVDMFLENNDSYNFYKNIDNGSYFIKTGHTGTNVMDLHILMISKVIKSNL